MGRETASGEGAPGGHGVNVHRGPEIRGPARSRGAREATPVRCRAWLQLACRAAAGWRTTRTCRFFDLRQCVALRALTSPTIVRPTEEIQRDGLRSDTARDEREVGAKAGPMLFGAWRGVQLLAAPATAQTRVADAWLDADQSNCHSEKWLALDWRLTLAATHCSRAKACADPCGSNSGLPSLAFRQSARSAERRSKGSTQPPNPRSVANLLRLGESRTDTA